MISFSRVTSIVKFCEATKVSLHLRCFVISVIITTASSSTTPGGSKRTRNGHTKTGRIENNNSFNIKSCFYYYYWYHCLLCNPPHHPLLGLIDTVFVSAKRSRHSHKEIPRWVDRKKVMRCSKRRHYYNNNAVSLRHHSCLFQVSLPLVIKK